MYVSESSVLWAVEQLKVSTHPFLGITFLACKKHELPVGKTASVRLDALTRDHLQEHHRLDPDSRYFFQPFKSQKNWVADNYASTGLQAVNTRTFWTVFQHERGKPEWGFRSDYVPRIRARIQMAGYRRTPLPAIAIWLAKNQEWPEGTTVEALVEDFIWRYNITRNEQQALFSPTAPLGLPPALLQSSATDLQSVSHHVEPPPDADEPQGTLAAIETRGVGPADHFRLDIGERLTIITGDNGLGKSFLLDVAWWAATNHWANLPATPLGKKATAAAGISYELRTKGGVRRSDSRYEATMRTWVRQSEYPQVPAVCVYARVDGAYSVVDDYRAQIDNAPLHCTERDVWEGKRGQTEGLLRDWVNWQVVGEDSFGVLRSVLECVSPDDLGPLTPSRPIQVPGYRQLIPVVEHLYGKVPLLFASAGVRRVLALAYIVVWAWREHLLSAEVLGMKPARRLVLFVDEIEAHLHPFWQRTILPTILKVSELLDKRLKLQIVVSTHSPFVLASMETEFDESLDTVFHLRAEGTKVLLEEARFHKRGNVSSWLTGPVFGLSHARSVEAEKALESAVALQLERSTDPHAIGIISDRLREVLPDDDPFWRRWIYFAEQAGVKL